jgi:hypothetical protein
MANPNPSPKTRFKKGQSGNPSGKSSEVLKAEAKAAEIAAKLRLAALSSLQEKIGDGFVDGELLELLMSAGALKLFKDSEDRAHGTPRQAVEIAGDPDKPLKTEEVGNGAAKLLAHLETIAERSRAAGEPSPE